MTKRTAKKPNGRDPLLRPCTACGAAKGACCFNTGRGGIQLPRIPYATRLVHAARLEEGTTDA